MTAVPKPSDLTSTYACKYDAWNRLAEVKAGEIVVARYEYDALNRRTKECVDTDLDGDFDEFRHFYYTFGWQLLETRLSESENTEPQTLQPEYQYVWSVRYMDAPVLRDKNTDEDDRCDDQRLYYANDANMNMTALLEDDGDVVERYMYDPYGKVTVLDADFSADADGKSDYDNRVLFGGYYFDSETGLYHVRNRYYHPYLGWITRDPAGYADGMSLYEYCASGPLGALDAMGLCKDSPEKIAEDLKNGKIKSAKELKERIEKLPKGQRGEAVRRAQEELRGWQPKNEGPVRRGGGGGDGDGVWSWERGVKDYGNPLAEENPSWFDKAWSAAVRKENALQNLFKREYGSSWEREYNAYQLRRDQKTFMDFLPGQLDLHTQTWAADVAQTATLGFSDTVNTWREQAWAQSLVRNTGVQQVATWGTRITTGAAGAVVAYAAAPITTAAAAYGYELLEPIVAGGLYVACDPNVQQFLGGAAQGIMEGYNMDPGTPLTGPYEAGRITGRWVGTGIRAAEEVFK